MDLRHQTAMKWDQAKLLVLILFLGGNRPLAHADALDHWTGTPVPTLSTPLSPTAFLLSVAYGDGRFVAVGEYDENDGAFVTTSDDGIHWVEQSTPATDLYSVTYGNGLFVAVGWGGMGNQDIYNSPDGINWVPITNGIVTNYRDVTYGGYYVAVGDDTVWGTSTVTNENIFISADGVTWTPQKSVSTSGSAHNLLSVAYGNGEFVAVDDSGNAYHSASGRTWTRASLGIGSAVSFCNDLFIASYGAGTNLVSSDGINWALVTNSTGGIFGKVIYANGYYIAGTSSNICTSTDGTNWTRRAQSPTEPVGPLLEACAYGNGVVVSICNLFGQKYPFAFVSDPVVAMGINWGAGGAALNLSGLNGRTNRIDYSTNLETGSGWQALTNIVLTNSPQAWTDSAATNGQRFYRAVLLP